MNIRKALSFVLGGVTGYFLARELKTNNLCSMPAILNLKDNTSDIIPTNMRKFSERERNTIQLMINGAKGDYSYLLINVYNDIFYRKKVEYRHGNEKSWLVFYRANMDALDHKEFLEIENEIMEISLLISYLKTNGLIYLIQNTSVNELNKVGGFLKDGLVEVHKELDSNIANILFESLNHRVFVGYTLRDLATNDFKSIEERTLDEAKLQTIETTKIVTEAKRQADAAAAQAQEASAQTKMAKRQMCLSYVAIFIAIVAIVVGALSSIWVAKNVVMDVKVDSTQVETVTKQIKEIEDKVDSLSIKKFLLTQEEKMKKENQNHN